MKIVGREPYGTSTVAMSAFNLLSTKGTAAGAEEVFKMLKMIQHPLLDSDLLDRALARLVEMGVVEKLPGGRYRSLARPGCVVVGRDASDARVNDETGEVEGGWRKWVARDPDRGLLPFSEVMP